MVRGKTVLVIEDNKKLMTNIKKYLEELGLKVITALNGELGITLAKENIPDIIICDIGLPGIDGYTVLTELSKDKTTIGIPFIFLTARIEKEDMRKGMLMGADDYIFKPFDLDDLMKSIINRFTKLSQLKDSIEVGNNFANEKYKIDDKVLVKIGKKMEFYPLKELKYLRTEHPYIYLKFINGKNTLLRNSLDEWELKLPKENFIRISQSSIINIEHTLKVEKVNSTFFTVCLKGEDKPIMVSRRFNKRIKEYLAR